MSVRVAPLLGAEFQRAIPDLARLRMEVFREWPYLYDGTYDYEKGYIEKFARSDGSVIIAAIDGSRVVGAATASPLAGHADAFAVPFKAAGHDIEKIFYFGELVLLPAYRGRGIGHQFFDAREAHAKGQPGYTHTAFCAVVRPATHPMQPPTYRTHDQFWTKRGYAKAEGLIARFDWKDIGNAGKTEKPMQFWMRAIP